MQIVESKVIVKMNVPYLKLDSSLDNKQRFETAETFNVSSKFKVLLISTKIGNLGLNLTGANTVIFMEHDWNPMNDIQAMD